MMVYFWHQHHKLLYYNKYRISTTRRYVVCLRAFWNHVSTDGPGGPQRCYIHCHADHIRCHIRIRFHSLIRCHHIHILQVHRVHRIRQVHHIRHIHHNRSWPLEPPKTHPCRRLAPLDLQEKNMHVKLQSYQRPEL